MRLFPFLSILLVTAAPGLADPRASGMDRFVAGHTGLPLQEMPGDVFAIGNGIILRGSATNDVHVAGFSVDVQMPVPEDLYASGGSVTIGAPVGSDLTAAGFSVRVAPGVEIAGNARLAGGSVAIDGPILGNMTVTGGDIMINAPIEGDVTARAEHLSFGADARIGGRLTYIAPAPITIQAAVIEPDRVTFRRDDGFSMTDWHRDWRMHDLPMLPTFLTMLSGSLMVLGFLTITGALCLMLAPALTERLRQSALEHPGASLLLGFLGLATLFGIVPVAVVTVVGIPLLPFAVLLILLAWTLGYLLGAYVLVDRMLRSVSDDGVGMVGRIGALAAVLLLFSLLNFIPVLGWMINVALMLFGLGALVRPLLFRLMKLEPPAPKAS